MLVNPTTYLIFSLECLMGISNKCYNSTLGLSSQTLPPVFPTQCLVPPFTFLSSHHLAQVMATSFLDQLNGFSTSKWVFYFSSLRTILCTAVKETAPPALKPCSGWFPSELGRKPQSLKGLYRPCLHLQLLSCHSFFHLSPSICSFVYSSESPHVLQGSSLCQAHLSLLFS